MPILDTETWAWELELDQGAEAYGGNYGYATRSNDRDADRCLTAYASATMEIRQEHQANPVEDPVGAYVAVARPILAGVLQSIAGEYLDAYDGDRAAIPLKMLGKLRAQGDGDTGIAFEYAIHDAIRTENAVVLERVAQALNECRIREGDPRSILFAIEKQGAKQLIDTDLDLITTDSRVLSGKQGQPAKLSKHMNQLAAAFRRPTTRLNLPQSIRGLWKADLFLGSQTPDHWVGTSVKYNPSRLESAPGLRIAIVPTQSGRSDAIKRDEQKNLVICPVPHDASFMQTFHEGWRIVQALCESNFEMPKDVDLPTPLQREAARVLVERREHTVEEVIDATLKFAQPHLLETTTGSVSTEAIAGSAEPDTHTVIGPFPLAS